MKNFLPIAVLALIVPTTAAASPPSTVSDLKTGATYTIAATDTYAPVTTPSDAFGWMNTGTGAVSMGTENGCSTTWTGTASNGWDGRAQWVAAGSPRSSTSCVEVGGTVIAHAYSRLKFAGVPASDAYRFEPHDTLMYVEYVVEGQIVKVADIIVNNRAPFEIGSPTEAYCRAYTQGGINQPQPGVAQDTTPPTVYAACSALGLFKSHASDPKPSKPGTASPAPATIAIPQSAARCAAVGKVAVRSTGVKCTSARSVVARYARSLKSPAGWSCSAAVNDAGRRVKCTPKAGKARAAARKAVYGVWRS